MTGEFVSATEQPDGKWIVVVRLTFQGKTFLHATELQPIPALVLSNPPVGQVIQPENP